jgi:hypothetical protein
MALTDNIIGCWSPSVRGGDGAILPDLSGRNNHGTLNGMSGTDLQSASVYGRSGRVLNGDATNNRVATALRLPTSSMTYGGWVICRALGGLGSNRPFGEADSAAGITGSSLLLTTSGPYVALRGSGASDISPSFPLVNNRWYLFVIVLGRQAEIWVDGRLVGSNTSTAITSRNVGFQILVDDIVNPTNGINGLVGEVCVWNRALTQSEVLEWFRRGNGAIGQTLTGRTRRRTYGFVAAGFKPYWARRQRQIIGGGT